MKFVEGVKNRVRTEHGHLVCENLTDCPLYGLVEYKENWLDADHIIEVMEFDDRATLKEINDPRTNGRLLCKLCHSDKNIEKRPAKRWA
ncbi:hypothetical protein J2T14_002076 [Paenibacillus harenae]|nr:hypothetical protein [Paenibacillus harenae]